MVNFDSNFKKCFNHSLCEKEQMTTNNIRQVKKLYNMADIITNPSAKPVRIRVFIFQFLILSKDTNHLKKTK